MFLIVIMFNANTATINTIKQIKTNGAGLILIVIVACVTIPQNFALLNLFIRLASTASNVTKDKYAFLQTTYTQALVKHGFNKTERAQIRITDYASQEQSVVLQL